VIPAIVVGMRKGELLPEYDQDIPPDFIDKVTKRADQTNAYRFGIAFDAKKTVEELANKGEEQIETFGTWQHQCVSAIVRYGLMNDISVRVPKGFTFSVNDFSLEDAVARTCVGAYPYQLTEDKNFLYFIPKKTD
jgi:hypothetical protein